MASLAQIPLLWPPNRAIMDLNFAQGVHFNRGNRTSPFSLPGWSYSGSVSGTGATVRTALNSAGTVINFANGQPRITDLGILIEEARTNLLLQSADLTSASWSANAGLLSRTSGFTAPDNTTTAVKIIADTSTGQHRLGQTLTGTAAAYTASIYAKAAGYNWLIVNMFDGTSANLASFNLATGAIGTLGSGNTATITPVANGFYRITVSRTMLASASAQALFYPSSADNTISITGDGVSGAILWGPQFEAGAFVTSYIPTTSAAVTRAADAVAISGVSLPNGPWTLFAQAYFTNPPTGENNGLAVVDDGPAGNNGVQLWIAASIRPRITMGAGGVGTYDSASGFSTITPSTVKMAASYTGSQITAQAQGVSLTPTTAASGFAATTRLGLGILNGVSAPTNGYIQRVSLHPSFIGGLTQ